jgi:hypothetical protein
MRRDFVSFIRVAAMTQNGKSESVQVAQEALIVHLRMGDSDAIGKRQDLFSLEDEIIDLMDKTSEGEYDGNEIGEGVFSIYIYGSSAERLWALISPILMTFAIAPGSFALKRFGPPGSTEQKIFLA